MIVAPVLLTVLFDRRKRKGLRALCAITMVPLVLNLVILQVRAAFIVLVIALMLVWILKLGFKWLPVFAIVFATSLLLVTTFSPEVASIFSDQMMPVITVDSDADVSVRERVDAIREGWAIAQSNWLLGIGPGAAVSVHSHDSAHQFQVQQAMETGMLGLFASTLFSIVTLTLLLRTFWRRRDERNSLRFLLLIGPACYVFYAILANATLGFGSVNSWTVVIMSMLALVPKADRQPRFAPAGRTAIGSVQLKNVQLKPELCQ
jgi:O-antigen ligase